MRNSLTAKLFMATW